MSLYLFLIALSPQFCGASPTAVVQSLEASFVQDKKIAYKGYLITSSYDPNTSIALATIKLRGRILARMKQTDNFLNSTQMALVSILGKGTKQVIIEQSSLGNKCCFYYRIYDLFPRLHLIFDSKKYPVGHDRPEIVDLDKDGVAELVMDDLTITFAEWLPFISSPRPAVTFKYEKRAGRYLPANRKFAGHILRGVEEEIAKVKEMNRDIEGTSSQEYLMHLLEVFSSLVYAGYASKAWAFYAKQYKLRDKRVFRTETQRWLLKDRVYRSIYRIKH
jgi:hypothetical protein